MGFTWIRRLTATAVGSVEVCLIGFAALAGPPMANTSRNEVAGDRRQWAPHAVSPACPVRPFDEGGTAVKDPPVRNNDSSPDVVQDDAPMGLTDRGGYRSAFESLGTLGSLQV